MLILLTQRPFFSARTNCLGLDWLTLVCNNWSLIELYNVTRGIIFVCSSVLFQTFYFISFLLVVVYAWKSKNVIQGWRAMPVDDEVRQVRQQLQIFKNSEDKVSLFFLFSLLFLSWFTEPLWKENNCYSCLCHGLVSVLIFLHNVAHCLPHYQTLWMCNLNVFICLSNTPG